MRVCLKDVRATGAVWLGRAVAAFFPKVFVDLLLRDFCEEFLLLCL